jgi:hypothetical protein
VLLVTSLAEWGWQLSVPTIGLTSADQRQPGIARVAIGKVVDDAFALRLFGFVQDGLLFGGRRMGRHCPSVLSM